MASKNVHICYSRKDKDRIQDLLKMLDEYGITYQMDIYNDIEMITPKKISVDDADSMLFICTANALNDKKCAAEWYHFSQVRYKKVRAILLDGVASVSKLRLLQFETYHFEVYSYLDKRQVNRLMRDLERVYQPENAKVRQQALETKLEAERRAQEEQERKQWEAEDAARAERKRQKRMSRNAREEEGTRYSRDERDEPRSFIKMAIVAVVLFVVVFFVLKQYMPMAGDSIPQPIDTVAVATTGEQLHFEVNGVSFTMVKVEGGTFTMGATDDQGSFVTLDEKPAHQVTLTDYYLGQTEVTQALWKAVMDESITEVAERKLSKTYGVGDAYPMYYISYDDCNVFIDKLNGLLSSKLKEKRFCLPTEAQWEFAARGGNHSQGYEYAGSNDLSAVAWYLGNSNGEAHPVMQKQANELGLYDMSGNVFEWCKDLFSSYTEEAVTNPEGYSQGIRRVSRSGSWCTFEIFCHMSYRNVAPPERTTNRLGFRLCLLP